MISAFSVWPSSCLRQIYPVQLPNEEPHQPSRTRYQEGQIFAKSFFFNNFKNSKLFNFQVKCSLWPLQSWLCVPICWRTSKITNKIKFGMFSSSLPILCFIKNSIRLSQLILPDHLVLRSTARPFSCPSLHYSSRERTNKPRFIQTCII